jgi:hypothetical protein
MKHVDMRKLPAAQEERRRQVIGLRRAGVFDICKRFAERGAAGLRTGPRGPEPGYGRFLDADQEGEVRELIRRHTPDGLDLPFALWSRAEQPKVPWTQSMEWLRRGRCGSWSGSAWGCGWRCGPWAPTWRAGASPPPAAIPSAKLMEPSAAPPRSRCGGPTSRTRRRCGAGCGGGLPGHRGPGQGREWHGVLG